MSWGPYVGGTLRRRDLTSNNAGTKRQRDLVYTSQRSSTQEQYQYAMRSIYFEKR